MISRQINAVLCLIQEHEHEIRRAWKRTSAVAVANVTKHGFWLLIGESEKFVAFDLFPWVRDATIGALVNVELPSAHHLYRPDLDVDLAIESIDDPERFPLVSKWCLNQSLHPPEEGRGG